MRLCLFLCLLLAAVVSSSPASEAGGAGDRRLEDPEFVVFLSRYLAERGFSMEGQSSSALEEASTTAKVPATLQPSKLAVLLDDKQFHSFLRQYMEEQVAAGRIKAEQNPFFLGSHPKEPVLTENYLLEALKERAAEQVGEIKSQLLQGAKAATEGFARAHLLTGPGATVKFDDVLVHIDDVRVFGKPEFRSQWDELVAKRQVARKNFEAARRKANDFWNDRIADRLNKGSLIDTSDEFQKLLAQHTDLDNAAHKLADKMNRIKPPTPPKILTPWEKFVKTKTGGKIDARLTAFKESKLGQTLAKHVHLPPPPSELAQKVAPNKVWDSFASQVKKIGAPKFVPVYSTDAKGQRYVTDMLYKKHKLLGWAHDGSVQRVAENLKNSFWQGYSNGKAGLMKGGNKAAYVTGKVLYAKGVTEPVVHAARAIKHGLGVAKTSARVLLSKAGPIAMIASGANAVTEAARDLSLLKDQAARGEELDPQLIRNVIFAFTGADVVLGRGGTELIGGAVLKGGKGLVKHLVGCLNLKRAEECGNRTIAGLKKAVEVTANAARKVHEWSKEKLSQAGNATATCFREKGVACVGHALRATGKGVVNGVKWMGKSVGDWFGKHIDHWKGRRQDKKEREAFCAASEANRLKCEREDAEVAANKDFVYGQLASNVGDYIKSAPAKTWNALKSWFSGGDD